MNYNGIYTATAGAASISNAYVFFELQLPTNLMIEIIRVWMGPAEGDTPVQEIQEIEIYTNDGVATGGSGMSEEIVQEGDLAASVVALTGVTQAATPDPKVRDSFHLQIGWEYNPNETERLRIGSSTADNIGMRFPVAPDAAITVPFGVTWGEFG